MFEVIFSEDASDVYDALEKEAKTIAKNKKKGKTSKQEGLFKQVVKSINYLKNNPRHQSLHTHKYESVKNPYNDAGPVFEAYVQNNTSCAYRLIWCYGPELKEITIISIIQHPKD